VAKAAIGFWLAEKEGEEGKLAPEEGKEHKFFTDNQDSKYSH
jgi:hypothetical protein